MKKTAWASAVAGVLISAASLASAAEPLQLTESQMDGVSAGAQMSYSTGTASALIGTAYSRSSTSAVASGPVRITRASTLSLATGFGVTATSSAGSTF